MSKSAVMLVCAIMMLSPAVAFSFASEVPAAESASPRAVIEITDVSELQAVNSNINGKYALANDIDASDTKNWNGVLGFLPLGNDGGSFYDMFWMRWVYPNAFNGTFDGRNFTITGLFINRSSTTGVGLFGITTKNATISNISLKQLTVVGGQYTGGLVGLFNAKISNCHANGTVNGTTESGGLVGYCEAGTISGSGSSVTVRGTSRLGGFVGSATADLSVITNSYSTGDIIGTSDKVGGFVGQNVHSTFLRCYSSGNASGTWRRVAGFVSDDYMGYFTNCYATGAASGTSVDEGGFAGITWGTTITNCYSTGQVSGTGGGFHGGDQGGYSVTGCYWDNQTSGKTTSLTGTGTNTTDMKKQATFAGWDFSGTWVIIENVTYPLLRCFYFPLDISCGGNLTATEDMPYVLHLVVNYSHFSAFNTLTVTVRTDAGPWLSFDNATLNLSGTPANSDYGTYWINATARDTMGSTSNLNLTLMVLNVNDPPTITTANVVSVMEDAPYAVQYAADDIDPTSDILSWSLYTNASWLELNATTGLLSGTPSNSDVGMHRVNVSVDDGHYGRDSRDYTLTVVNVNDPPVITTTDVTEATQSTPYSVQYAATDIDPASDIISWALRTDADWLGLNSGSGRLSGTPTSADIGAFWVNVTASDGNGGSDFRNFTLTVQNINDRPTITTVPPATATEGVEYRVAFNVTDPDAGDSHTWALGTDAEWLAINATSGVLSGTPEDADAGTSYVTVTVTDSAGATDTLNYKLKVENVNEPPTWVSVPADTTVTEGASLFLDALATDPEAGTSLRYGISSQPACGIAINPVSGALRWLNATSGNYTVTVNATDGLLTINAAFNITVNRLPAPPVPPANHPPTITPVSAASVKTGQALSIKVTGSDQDSHDAVNLTFRLVSGPVGMVISADGSLLWTPTKDQAGTHTVTVSLSDGKNSTTSSFQITATKPAPAGGTASDAGNSVAIMALLLVAGLVMGAVVVYALTRRKPERGVSGGGEDE